MTDPMEFVQRAQRAQEAVNALGAGPPDVLPGFEEEERARLAARLNANAAKAAAAADPTVETWTGPDGTPRYTLTRSQPWESEDGHKYRAVTVILSPAEWAVIADAVLAQYNLTTLKGTS